VIVSAPPKANRPTRNADVRDVLQAFAPKGAAEPPVPPDVDELVVELLREAESYRALAQAAIHQLHDLTGELRRLRDAHERLLAEYRRARHAAITGKDAAA
jgi:hypothetical protein